MKQRYSYRPLAAATLALCLAGTSTLPAQTINLSQIGITQPGFVINGIDASDFSGYSVSGAGDVNGDGLADLIVGANLADPDGKIHAGESYVIFGKTDSTPIHLSNLGTDGFQINGMESEDRSGSSVSGAGDVNGDGLADLIIGAPRSNPTGIRSGESYVVFGKRDSSTVELSNLGTGGFQINGFHIFDQSGNSVSGAGDVNGDGLADLIIGAYFAATNNDYTGESYVVFGKSDPTTVELSNLGYNGFQIKGSDPYDYSGRSVSGAGDVNGDGLADLIIGAYQADANGDYSGESYVIFGKTDSNTVELSNLSTAGFQINGIDVEDYSGVAVSGAGDVNGDGLADLLVGANEAGPYGDESGEGYVVFGKANSDTIELSNLGMGGFQIRGIDDSDNLGYSVSGAGDVNGDGLADIILGAYKASPNGTHSGESYVVFGKPDTYLIELSSLGTSGFQINGINTYNFSGRSVSGAGDVNGDGLADIIVGAYLADPGNPARESAGESYVIFSPSPAPASPTFIAKAKAGDAPRVAVGISGDGSNDSTPDARAFIDFADGATTSTQTVTLTRDNDAIENLDNAADVMWEVSTNRTGWTSAEVCFNYTDAEILGLDESKLTLYIADNPAGPWNRMTKEVTRESRNQVCGITSHFSYFALAEKSNRARIEQADGTFIVVESPVGTVIDRVELLVPTLTIPSNTSFPEGLIDLQISGGPVGGTIPVTITYENRLAGPAYEDFFVPDGSTYAPISPAAVVNDNGTTVTVTLQLAD